MIIIVPLRMIPYVVLMVSSFLTLSIALYASILMSGCLDCSYQFPVLIAFITALSVRSILVALLISWMLIALEVVM